MDVEVTGIRLIYVIGLSLSVRAASSRHTRCAERSSQRLTRRGAVLDAAATGRAIQARPHTYTVTFLLLVHTIA